MSGHFSPQLSLAKLMQTLGICCAKGTLSSFLLCYHDLYANQFWLDTHTHTHKATTTKESGRKTVSQIGGGGTASLKGDDEVPRVGFVHRGWQAVHDTPFSGNPTAGLGKKEVILTSAPQLWLRTWLGFWGQSQLQLWAGTDIDSLGSPDLGLMSAVWQYHRAIHCMEGPSCMLKAVCNWYPLDTGAFGPPQGLAFKLIRL